MIRSRRLGGKLLLVLAAWLASVGTLPAELRVLPSLEEYAVWATNSPSQTNFPVEVIDPRPDADGISRTGMELDLAIRGSGWFVVRDPDTDEEFYRRLGDFRLDVNGYVVTARGLRLQGFNDPSRTQRGDLQLNNYYPPDSGSFGGIVNVQFETNGNMRIYPWNGTDYVRAQVLLQKFSAPENLERVELGLFAGTAAAQSVGLPAAPGSNGLGEIVAAALEVTSLPALLKPLPAADDPAIPLIEGVAYNTSCPTDFAIRGAGAFLVRDPQTSELFATRAGTFLLDREGYLITYDRKRVQGRRDAFAGDVGDIQVGVNVPVTTEPTAAQTYIYTDSSGRVNVGMSDGTQYAAGQILLYDFQHPEQLIRANLGQFVSVAAAQPSVIEQVGRYGGSFSRIEQSRLELINVPRDLVVWRERLSLFSQGSLYRTSVPSHLALDGVGFFQLRNPTTGERFVTRRGDFRVDSDGYLISAKGLRVQGFSNSLRNELGDVRIDSQGVPATTDPNATFVFFSISRDGKVNVHMSDGTEFMRSQVLLQNFREPFQLRPARDGLYKNLAAAWPVDLAEPGTSGLGGVQSSALENPVERERLTLPARDGFRLAITGEPGSRWTIQATEDFALWKTIGTITNAGFESEFCDRDAKCHPRRFYRVLAEYPVYIPPANSVDWGIFPTIFDPSTNGVSVPPTELRLRARHRPIYRLRSR